ncbi:hypothetical protein RB195_021850 [Necator americanus]|uniref:Metalloendopeptidase n=1 Tax=Necator americanus TaxID=51031 RepID=A0ABR1ECZ9_NECAM
MSRLYDENQDFIMDGQYNGDYAMCSVDRHMEAQNGFIKRQPVTYGQISTGYASIFLSVYIEDELSMRHISWIQKISLIALTDAMAATLFIAALKTVHLHPAITIAHLFSLTTSWLQCVFVIIIQLIAAITANLTITLMRMDGLPPYVVVNTDINMEWTKAIYKLYYDKSIPDEETLLNVVDFHRSRTLGNFDHKHVNDSAMYAANRFEGDIVSVNIGLNSHSVNSFFTQQPLFAVFGVQRNAVKQTRSKIAEAIEEYRKKTCIDFSPKSAADQDYIHIVPDDGCYSLVGRIGGKQPVSLGDGCIQKGIIIHELMHVVGFFHEQSRADRDDHIIINWSNVESGLQDQFDKYSLQMIDHLNTVYDYGSVMHYASTAFSKNGKPTIEPRKKGAEIGQRTGFSDIDLYKINKLYNCPQAETTSSPLPETKTDMKSEARASVKTDKKGPTGSGSVAGSASTSEKSSLISVLTKVACTDKRPDCEFLARAGHCESKFSETFMKDNCPQSCGKCEITTTTATTVMEQCEDARSWCERWANSGMCTQQIFRDYMRIKCAKSCQLC